MIFIFWFTIYIKWDRPINNFINFEIILLQIAHAQHIITAQNYLRMTKSASVHNFIIKRIAELRIKNFQD